VVLESPGDTWAQRTMTGDGLLYKAEATGDYTYRGTDPASYDEVFDQESGDTDDLTPLIEFLRFVDESSDADFASGLADRLDVQAFATYLALEDLMDNFDAIDGPGNNSYLWWDRGSSRMTVVGWDHNLTFGVGNNPGADQGGGAAAAGGPPPAAVGGGAPPPGLGGGAGGPGGRRANPLVTRFAAASGFAALQTAAATRLRAELYAGGVASASLERWSALLEADAGELLDPTTLASEKAAIATYFA
jgi:spore coat protein CotH